MIIGIMSCSHTPTKLEKYINNHNLLKDTSDASIDLRDALKTDYDTMFVFDSFTPITGVKRIIGIPDYGYSDNPETALICSDSEMCKIILVKNKKVVYDDEYYFNDYYVKIDYHGFDTVINEGIFDGEKIKTIGYINTDPVLRVNKDGKGISISKKGY